MGKSFCPYKRELHFHSRVGLLVSFKFCTMYYIIKKANYTHFFKVDAIQIDCLKNLPSGLLTHFSMSQKTVRKKRNIKVGQN